MELNKTSNERILRVEVCYKNGLQHGNFGATRMRSTNLLKSNQIKIILPTFRCKIKGPQHHFFRANWWINSKQEKSNPNKSTSGYDIGWSF
uniref:Uncharacterized protein n=1 Tax=Lepeophtheirus salmonis TaxID=72036 RepID=A0A0K2T7D5_LEPSM